MGIAGLSFSPGDRLDDRAIPNTGSLGVVFRGDHASERAGSLTGTDLRWRPSGQRRAIRLFRTTMTWLVIVATSKRAATKAMKVSLVSQPDL
jgi:hypothetical protein